VEQVPLLTVPSQSLSIALGGDFYDIRVKAAGTIMAVDIIRNQVLIVTGMRAEANYPLIPYPYLEQGNLFFITRDDEYPWYERFNIDQNLFYLTQEEVEALRNAT
jgi:hypothetical protein